MKDIVSKLKNSKDSFNSILDTEEDKISKTER